MSWANNSDFFAGCGLRSSPVGVLDTPGVYGWTASPCRPGGADTTESGPDQHDGGSPRKADRGSRPVRRNVSRWVVSESP